MNETHLFWGALIGVLFAIISFFVIATISSRQKSREMEKTLEWLLQNETLVSEGPSINGSSSSLSLETLTGISYYLFIVSNALVNLYEIVEKRQREEYCQVLADRFIHAFTHLFPPLKAQMKRSEIVETFTCYEPYSDEFLSEKRQLEYTVSYVFDCAFGFFYQTTGYHLSQKVEPSSTLTTTDTIPYIVRAIANDPQRLDILLQKSATDSLPIRAKWAIDYHSPTAAITLASQILFPLLCKIKYRPGTQSVTGLQASEMKTVIDILEIYGEAFKPVDSQLSDDIFINRQQIEDGQIEELERFLPLAELSGAYKLTNDLICIIAEQNSSRKFDPEKDLIHLLKSKTRR